ncbi:MAG: NTP transferase domain-containing protein [Planctomycetes bacterium]|nr:NTP transferase domain-containing protein [Planctomycetota bacterium]
MNSQSQVPRSTEDRPLTAIILAAGQGTRMNSDLPKVIHAVCARPMVYWVVRAAREAGASRIILIVGHGADHVREAFAGDDADIEYAIQEPQLGTGHAITCAESLLKDFEGDVVILGGDGPLIRAETIRIMHIHHCETSAAATLATSIIDDPTGYGRILRDPEGRFEAIIEHKNATDAQRAIHEVYPSYACFDAILLFDLLRQLEPDSVSGEYYLTEIPGMLKARGQCVELVDAVPPEDVLSINTPEQLAQVEAILSNRLQAAEVEST